MFRTVGQTSHRILPTQQQWVPGQQDFFPEWLKLPAFMYDVRAVFSCGDEIIQVVCAIPRLVGWFVLFNDIWSQ